jgi:tousled-like kinase
MDSLPSKIIHYDLKPQNILFHEGAVKVADFGLCKIVDSNDTKIELTSQGSGTYWYLPPETFDNTPKISNKVDVWSVGVIFYEMLYGKRPFGHGMSQNKIFHEGIIVSANKAEFPNEPCISDEAKKFIYRCLEYHQEARLSVNEAYNHHYFSKS